MFMRALDIMSTSVVTVDPHAKVTELAQLLTEKGISGVPVVDGNHQLVGIVTEADVLTRKLGQNTVYDIMTTDVISARDDDSVADIAALLTKHRIKRVPILHGGKLVGVVSRADVVKAYPTA